HHVNLKEIFELIKKKDPFVTLEEVIDCLHPSQKTLFLDNLILSDGLLQKLLGKFKHNLQTLEIARTSTVFLGKTLFYCPILKLEIGDCTVSPESLVQIFQNPKLEEFRMIDCQVN